MNKNRWYCISDSSFNEIEIECVLAVESYITFYQLTK